MTKRYLYKDPKNDVVVGYDSRLPLAEECARYTARTYKGKLYVQEEGERPSLIEDFSDEKKKHKN